MPIYCVCMRVCVNNYVSILRNSTSVKWAMACYLLNQMAVHYKLMMVIDIIYTNVHPLFLNLQTTVKAVSTSLRFPYKLHIKM